jgi:hypothetical protein
MLEPFRREFNTRQFSPEKYLALQTRLNERTRTQIEFRICETPCFFSRELLDEMAETGRALTHQLIDNADYMRLSDAAIPEQYRVPNENPRPNFMTVDFGLVRGEDDLLHPKLVELQAFPSIFGYQDLLCEQYIQTYGLDKTLDWRFGGLDAEGYWRLLRQTIVGSHEPENVVLTEVEPETQKTRPDFHVYEDRLGITTVDIAKLKKEGNRLFYERRGRWVPIERIYNRAIVDEMERKGIKPAFDHRDDLQVEWAGQPNWYFRISKFSLPYLDHASVPACVFLDEWFAGKRECIPQDREKLLLKPLYSFAGKGIQFAPTDAELNAIPKADRHGYLLQKRMLFEPVIDTPHGMTQAEVRVMYCWPDGASEMTPCISLVRLGRGLMMGVDHNRNQEWVGGSAALFPTASPSGVTQSYSEVPRNCY